MKDLDKFELVAELFSNIDVLDKKTYLHDAFLKIIKIIPLSQKGTLFEIINNKVIPIESYGYDMDILNELSINTEEASRSFLYSIAPIIKARTIYVENSKKKSFSSKSKEAFRKLGTLNGFYSLYTPLVVNKEVIGIFCLDNFDEGFDDYSKNTLTVFATIISSFYEKVIKQDMLSKTYYNAIKALVSAIEIKDSYTKGHGERVSALSKQIAIAMKLSNKQIEDIGIGALLHDVGKIGIPEQILNKFEPLTPEELRIIRSHPEMSRKIVSSIDNEIGNIVYSHHELLDGSGYPRGLKGDEIPLGSSIIQVADIFDALTSNRAYRKPCTNKEAILYLTRYSRVLYHHEVVKQLSLLFK